jgi:hypothetical protein
MTTEGGGWTRISGSNLQRRGWVEFEVLNGPAAPLNAGWTVDGEFELRADRRTTVVGCETVVIRATAQLPFKFEAWRGSWQAFHAGNDSESAAFGGSLNNEGAGGCDGAVLFGAPRSDVKFGSEWGYDHSATKTVAWATKVPLVPTNLILWELNGIAPAPAGDSDAFLEVSDLEMWVR